MAETNFAQIQADRDAAILDQWTQTDAYEAFMRMAERFLRAKKVECLNADASRFASAQGAYQALQQLIGDAEFGKPGMIRETITGWRARKAN
jgi:hypothetical protein